MFGKKNPAVSEFMRKRTGSDHPNWNQNITKEERLTGRFYPEYREWRRLVYERDSYTCQACGDDKGGNLIAHHLEGYANNKKLRTILNNGITLCENCHKNFHHQYGNRDNTEKQFKKFIGD